MQTDHQPSTAVSSSPPLVSQQFRLADGRRLGYLEYGDPDGLPVLLFHGLPASRLQGHPDRSIAADTGVRLIGVDRPGYGLSDYQPNRALLDWPADVAALADGLGLDRFAIVGISGGGPYAAACAWKIPERLSAVTLVSPMGRLADDAETLANMPWISRFMLSLAQRNEGSLRLPGTVLRMVARHWMGGYLGVMNAHLPAVDRKIYHRPAVQALIRADLLEAFRNGPDGAVHDIVLLARPWGFTPRDIHMPVQLWHGEQDTTVPIRIARSLAASIPDCRPHFLDQAGHYLFVDCWRQILGELLQQSALNHPVSA